MANPGEPNQNGSQFFITVGECQWLNKKHTVFGCIEGDTIFNAIQISELETDGDRPICDLLPRIKRAEVLENPFDDIIPRNLVRQRP